MRLNNPMLRRYKARRAKTEARAKARKKRIKRTKMKHIGAAKWSYVTRPSQITRSAPTKRLRKRRRKQLAKPVKGRFPNPRPLLFIITAQKAGKKMHFDGTNFSERARVSTFATMAAAESRAQSLLKSFPVLRSYKVMIEANKPPNFH